MMRFKVKIAVRRKKGVADPEGNTIGEALKRLGHKNVQDVHVQRLFELIIDVKDAFAVRKLAQKVAKEVLTNPVIEEFSILDVEKVD